MCNHYKNDPDAISDWAEYAGYRRSAKTNGVSDVWPKRLATVARIDAEEKMLDAMIWGVPRTMPGKRPGTTVTKNITNVRNLTSPFWQSMLTNPERRCLVPFTAFAEPKIGAGREEHWFAVSTASVAAFAGIWRPAEPGNVFAFLTCEPNPLVASLHPKAMPVILHPDDYDTWLTADYEDACALATPFPSQLMTLQAA
jgi:putative SOS response-associated peptidase YedK